MAGSKLQYAIQALVEINRQDSSGPVGTREIAKSAGLSKRYLEQVFGLLRRSGVVRSSRGKFGGYELESDPERISVERIWQAVGEEISIPVNKPERTETDNRAAFEIQSGLYEAAVRYLRGLSLRDVIDLENSDNEMFYI